MATITTVLVGAATLAIATITPRKTLYPSKLERSKITVLGVSATSTGSNQQTISMYWG